MLMCIFGKLYIFNSLGRITTIKFAITKKVLKNPPLFVFTKGKCIKSENQFLYKYQTAKLGSD